MDFFVRMYMRVCTHKAGKNASIRDKKTHVYRVAGMIATIRGKKPRVYRVIILKHMADHKLLAGYLLTSSANIMEYEASVNSRTFTF